MASWYGIERDEFCAQLTLNSGAVELNVIVGVTTCAYDSLIVILGIESHVVYRYCDITNPECV